jgi:hypothetical protein
MNVRRVIVLWCLCVLDVPITLAQNSTSIPARPSASDTLVVKPKPPPPEPRDVDCVPGAACDRPGQRDTRNPGNPAPPRRTERPETPQVPTPEVSADTDETPASELRTPAAGSAGANNQGAPAVPAAAGATPTRELLAAAADIAEGDAQRAWLAQQGVGVLRRRVLPALGWVLTVYRVPPGTDLPTLLAAFTSQWPDATPEVNQRYLQFAPPADATRYAASLIALPEEGCARAVQVAMLDGPVNLALPAFAGRVRSTDIAQRGANADLSHATGIAAMLLGADGIPGLLPNARLLAANVFAESRGKPYTSTEWILRGLDWVLGQKPVPVVVNLSFGGPESAQLARAVRRVQLESRIVAAAGNDGATRPVYPAAYPGVVAVTAVDVRRRRWPRANTGEFVAIAAPGVDVWTIDGQGNGYYASGTSFAAAHVSAAIAMGSPAQAALPTWLQLHAEDLGPPGRDRWFGFGLLSTRGLCD